MCRCVVAPALFLLIGAILPQTVPGHFFWAETNTAADHVTVTFSENAGVPDKVIAIMERRVTRMAYYNGSDTTVDVALTFNDEKTMLEGDLPRSSLNNNDDNNDNNDGPALVSGYLDFGSFEKFHDLEYSFGAQVYSSEADYDAFFRPLLLLGNEQPLIVMRNCGGSSHGTSYQFDVGGFPSEGPLGVCIYRKGGIQMGCGEFVSGEPEVYGLPRTMSLGRTLRRGENHRNPTMDLSIELSTAMLEQHQEEVPYLLYAIANKTIADKASGDSNIVLASTSVYFEGPCKE